MLGFIDLKPPDPTLSFILCNRQAPLTAGSTGTSISFRVLELVVKAFITLVPVLDSGCWILRVVLYTFK